ncbi:hypothetical protein TEA_004444 [Camellia sinensis var. sinensis]|uniref:Uncharacterized protein n=1 Tax=Camellia sinensis var. sinensis TaxID=542762 RepID=A0A4S4CWG8_CAMSN|nr:hypothetical protein TEA_004444 [Camellia sinensis var. sinensis]
MASNRRRARQTEPEPVEVNVPVEEDDHVDVNNDYVGDDIGVEDDDVDNDIVVEAGLMEDDVVHRLGRDECVLHPYMLYEIIGRMLQVLDGQSLGSTSTRTEHQVKKIVRPGCSQEVLNVAVSSMSSLARILSALSSEPKPRASL